MDTETLVENRIDGGQELIDQLVRDGFEIHVAFWIKKSEEGLWRLYIASPSVNSEKLGAAYGLVYTSLGKIHDLWISPSDIQLLNGTNPIAQRAIAERDRFPEKGPIRYHGKRLGSMAIEEAYIYPPPGKWFKGFDEIKRNFPSAEVFTLPVLCKDATPPSFMGCVGRINAAEFEGKAPGTVLFMGPSGSSGKAIAHLTFVHRPEGWNTLYRADTKGYEEVRFTGTNQPPYRSVDFGPLTALKTGRKPGYEQIDRIKGLMDQGYFITLPPDNTPIQTIPFTYPTKSGSETPTPLDWEALRTHLEGGGRIDLHSPAMKDIA